MIVQEAFLEEAFQGSPYRRPIVGYPDDFLGLGRREVEGFFKARYRPEKLTCAVVGEVDPEEVERLAMKYFGAWQPANRAVTPGLDRWLPVEGGELLEQTAPREVRMVLPAGPYLQEGYRRPPTSDPDSIVLDVISDVLNGGRSARFQKNLVEPGKALYSSLADTFPQGKLSNLFMVAGVPGKGYSTDDLAKLMRQELNAFSENGVEEKELARIKKKTRADLLSLLASNSTMANLLCSYHAKTGDFRNLFREPLRVDQVTSEVVKRVAQKVFNPSNRTSGHVLPP
ncbi:hypothetical protein CYMTET_51881 [Cymbomonas tetramitiformis]|uniref:Peptidase M16 C-terminal domain-containing protein n=1 Tax=Cymbomonas tetramitiformis TaxID=36881 RepID=A0AAE0BLE8_9CHLO|nr:hypothetical protein CYMTET_51881 [Cymbomonas tetramitiformis]